jgi:cell wall-associated NlpC family hydrolase
MRIRTGYDRRIGDWRPVSKNAETSKLGDESISNKDLESIVKPWLGTPYQFGGQSKKGVDCSGFVQLVIRAYKGVQLPRNSGEAFKQGSSVSKSNLEPGDVLYFGSFWGIDHAGVWLGKGRFVHSATSRGVMITELAADPYWSDRFRGGRRYGN